MDGASAGGRGSAATATAPALDDGLAPLPTLTKVVSKSKFVASAQTVSQVGTAEVQDVDHDSQGGEVAGLNLDALRKVLSDLRRGTVSGGAVAAAAAVAGTTSTSCEPLPLPPSDYSLATLAAARSIEQRQ